MKILLAAFAMLAAGAAHAQYKVSENGVAKRNVRK